MSRKDFEQCTPLEFTRIVEKHNALEEVRIREGWERTRIEVVSVANLFSKHPVNARKAFPLPWDNDETKEEKTTTQGTSSPERMKEVMAKLNGE